MGTKESSTSYLTFCAKIKKRCSPLLADLYRRRPAEPGKMPRFIRHTVGRGHHAHRLVGHHFGRWNRCRRRQRGMHRHAQWACCLTRHLRRIRSYVNLCLLVRQPLSMHVNGLRRTRKRDQQKAQDSNPPQPDRLGSRMQSQGSVLESLQQGFGLSVRGGYDAPPLV
jgi:hypothetical protein